METELRRRRIELLTLGSGIIAFGVWSVLKTFLYVWVAPLTGELDVAQQYRSLVLAVSYGLIALIVLIDLRLRLYIGLSARKEGVGKRVGKTYIIVAAFVLAVNIVTWIATVFVYRYQEEQQALMDYIVSLAVDLTSMALMGRLLHNAIRVRQLRRQLEG